MDVFTVPVSARHLLSGGTSCFCDDLILCRSPGSCNDAVGELSVME